MNAKCKQKMELKISQQMKAFLENFIGEYPKSVTTKILGDMIIVRFKNILPPAERDMSRFQEGAKTIKALKEKIFIDSKPLLKELIECVTRVEVVDVHSSFDVKSDQRIEVFTLIKNLC